ncbi:hypothetical protein Pst134EB_019853 [Puccinia striiformis f. sp. tritici]|nr:hypothetical protein Pst134EB_019853 [Puccinia striiformis f. sp. tritici]
MRLQEELQQTRTELAQKTAEMQNLSLNHRMELMQARMDAAQSGMFMQSMPAMMGGGMFPRASYNPYSSTSQGQQGGSAQPQE